jgi:hypothetical protein
VPAADITQGVAEVVSVRGGIAGLAIAACMAVLGVLARRVDRGDAAAMDGLRDLNDRLARERSEAFILRGIAEKEADDLRLEMIQAREYARSLESRLGVPHRDWTVQ